MGNLISFTLKMCIVALCFVIGMLMMGGEAIGPALVPVDIKPNLPKFGTAPKNPSLYPIIQLHRNGRGFCSASVIDANYAVTAAHCVRSGLFLDDTAIQIFDREGKDTKVVAQAVALSNRIDVALIKGDFNNFRPLRVEFYDFSPTNSPAVYQACGFPGLQNRVTCTKFIPTHNQGFYIAGRGFLIPGMSGGPVYDVTHDVVIGVNSASTTGFVLVAPVLGLLGNFGIEP